MNDQKTKEESWGYNKDTWGLWKADWKSWWGGVLGSEQLKKGGLKDREQITGKPKPGMPLKKSHSLDSDISIGVHGSKVSPSGDTHPVTSSFYPEWKYPSFERNKYDDELLMKKQEIGGGNQ
ncbi:hypothetical protein DLAC_10033 [Tieghemostelium lacteum]|uniref:Uncharacterized protein n=1 Tax=Tieghemostelium lacteum TaxID=361077 RepID=A0A151Z5Y6_TIELA|nr:hypothetical protein DLAC_10033 [Tieghemostelium lacteum]|eukprot:KYQ89371.1 hypothetical protein DLAC_10033 [Tieghemostelium lacteum]